MITPAIPLAQGSMISAGVGPLLGSLSNSSFNLGSFTGPTLGQINASLTRADSIPGSGSGSRPGTPPIPMANPVSPSTSFSGTLTRSYTEQMLGQASGPSGDAPTSLTPPPPLAPPAHFLPQGNKAQLFRITPPVSTQS